MNNQKSATVAILHNNNVLLLKRGDSAPWMPGRFCLPGGKLELNETLEDGALREVMEETGIVLVRESLIPFLIRYKNNRTKIVFASMVSSDIVNLNWEHSDYRWVGFENIGNYKLVPGLHTTLVTISKSSFVCFS